MIEENLNRWIKEINEELAVNITQQEESWFKSLHTALILINKTTKHLEDAKQTKG